LGGWLWKREMIDADDQPTSASPRKRTPTRRGAAPQTSAEVEAELARHNLLVERRAAALQRRLQRAQRAHRRREALQLRHNTHLLAELGDLARGHRETRRALDVAVAGLRVVGGGGGGGAFGASSGGGARPVGLNGGLDGAGQLETGEEAAQWQQQQQPPRPPSAAAVQTITLIAPSPRSSGARQPRPRPGAAVAPSKGGGGALAPAGLGAAVKAIVQAEHCHVVALQAALRQSEGVMARQSERIAALEGLVARQREEGARLMAEAEGDGDGDGDGDESPPLQGCDSDEAGFDDGVEAARAAAGRSEEGGGGRRPGCTSSLGLGGGRAAAARPLSAGGGARAALRAQTEAWRRAGR
jgi:hypothetical protein